MYPNITAACGIHPTLPRWAENPQAQSSNGFFLSHKTVPESLCAHLYFDKTGFLLKRTFEEKSHVIE